MRLRTLTAPSMSQAMELLRREMLDSATFKALLDGPVEPVSVVQA